MIPPVFTCPSLAFIAKPGVFIWTGSFSSSFFPLSPILTGTSWTRASQIWANYSVNGARENPGSFSEVTHSSWCLEEFGQVPICSLERLCHNLLLLSCLFFPIAALVAYIWPPGLVSVHQNRRAETRIQLFQHLKAVLLSKNRDSFILSHLRTSPPFFLLFLRPVFLFFLTRVDILPVAASLLGQSTRMREAGSALTF